jgi:hypothetical protein
MTGPKLVAGIVVMGVAVPLLLFYLLDLRTISQLLTVSAVTFFAWGVADLTAEILIRPRLRDRNPRGAIEDWEKQRESGEDEADKTQRSA